LRNLYSYVRLLIGSWLFMGGIALQFLPSAAWVDREARWRERRLQAVPADEHAKWVEDRDLEDARSQAYVRALGVLIGGVGFAVSLREAVYLGARYGR
jgi:hypothetical protein